MPEESSRIAALLAGEADLITVFPPSELKRINDSGRASAGAVPEHALHVCQVQQSARAVQEQSEAPAGAQLRDRPAGDSRQPVERTGRAGQLPGALAGLLRLQPRPQAVPVRSEEGEAAVDRSRLSQWPRARAGDHDRSLHPECRHRADHRRAARRDRRAREDQRDGVRALARQVPCRAQSRRHCVFRAWPGRRSTPTVCSRSGRRPTTKRTTRTRRSTA